MFWRHSKNNVYDNKIFMIVMKCRKGGAAEG